MAQQGTACGKVLASSQRALPVLLHIAPLRDDEWISLDLANAGGVQSVRIKLLEELFLDRVDAFDSGKPDEHMSRMRDYDLPSMGKIFTQFAFVPWRRHWVQLSCHQENRRARRFGSGDSPAAPSLRLLTRFRSPESRVCLRRM
jgi:hypothetical protein